MIKYTAQNPYDRFPDGRPKVPDSILKRSGGCRRKRFSGLWVADYPNQFVDGMQVLHPGKKLVGRALTLQLMPIRADIARCRCSGEESEGRRRLSHQTAIDMLQPGDVFVVDACGSIAAGGIIGDNLAYYIWKKTGAGFVIDGAIRDLEGIAAFDMAGYFRGADAAGDPKRHGDRDQHPGPHRQHDGDARATWCWGIARACTFIPPHLVKDIVDAAEITHIHDEWTRLKFDEGKYKSSEIYSSPRDPALLKEYEEYLKLKLGPERYAEYVKRRGERPVK